VREVQVSGGARTQPRGAGIVSDREGILDASARAYLGALAGIAKIGKHSGKAPQEAQR
jgi:hypothetical protein